MTALARWSLPLALAATAATTTAQVPKATPVVVQTYNAINSATFHPGERLAYVVSQDVIVDGVMIARAGDMAEGVVEDARQGSKTHAGTLASALGPAGAVAGGAANKALSKGANLRVTVTKLDTFCGGHIALSFVRSEYHAPKRFHKMTAVEIDKGQKYIAPVAHDTATCGVATTRTPAPIPPDALPPDQSSP